MTASLFLPLVAGLAGACVGSFAATAALRSLRGEQALVGRSHCDGCGVVLGFAATTPVLSYAAFGGACRSCKSRIDPAHIAGEVVGAVVAAAAFWIAPPLEASLISVMGMALVAASIIDQRSRRLPDLLTLIVTLCALGLAVLNGRVLIGLAAAAVTFVLLDGLRRGFVRLRGRTGLGFGDVKLFSAAALWLGLETSWAVAVAAVIGLLSLTLTRPADGRIVLGPAIAAATLVVGLAQQAGLSILDWGLA